MADRVERVKSIIGKNITDIIQFELRNPKIGFCTVKEVWVSQDYSYARVYVTFLGTKYPRQNLEELNKCRGFVRSSLAKKLDIRKTPQVEFLLDEAEEKASHLDEILKKEQEKLDSFKK